MLEAEAYSRHLSKQLEGSNDNSNDFNEGKNIEQRY
jgi:hypothetical protein